jgi:PhnB protein
MTDPAQRQPSYTPPGGPVLTPYICPREAAEAIAWYADIFDAVETSDRFVDPEGRVGHANLAIDGAHLMVSDAYPDFGAVAPEVGNRAATFALQVYVPDVDETVRRAEAAGALVQRPPEDQFYGSRQATLMDPFGVRWMVTTFLHAVASDEISAAAATFGKTGAQRGPVDS